MILICCAVGFEAGALRGLCGPGCRLVVTGVGSGAARRAVGKVVRRGGVRLVIGTGLAGGLVPGLVPGDLVLAENRTSDEAMPRLRDGAWRVASVVTVDRVVGSDDERAALARSSGAVAADMESAGIWDVAGEAGVLCVTLRAISDGVGCGFPVPASLLARAAEGPRGVVELAGHVLCNPRAAAQFPRFVRRCGAARRAMRGGVEDALRRFGEPVGEK